MKCKNLTLKNNFYKIALLTCLTLVIASTSGCRTIVRTLDAEIKPLPTSFPLTPPKGPEVYRQGWMDGCHSGLASTNEMVRPEFRFYSHKLDRNLQHNKTYWRVWNDAYNYCAFTMLTMMNNHS